MKEKLCTLVGVLGAGLAGVLGGWDGALAALMVCMGVDYISGSLVALVFHASPKSPTGSYNSAYGLKGLCRKGMMLMLVLVAVRLDALLGGDYVRDGVCFGFCANETLSIVENLGLAGIPMPQAITNALEQLQNKQK